MTAAPDPERPRPDAGGSSAPALAGAPATGLAGAPATGSAGALASGPAGAGGSSGAGTALGPLIVLVSNFPDETSARDTCECLLEERLIACANIQAPCRSLYRWDGKTQDGTEVPVWVKTSRARATAARLRLAALHPYDVPEILVLEVAANSAYAAWVEGETLP